VDRNVLRNYCIFAIIYDPDCGITGIILIEGDEVIQEEVAKVYFFSKLGNYKRIKRTSAITLRLLIMKRMCLY
jgi:hypothetical protein